MLPGSTLAASLVAVDGFASRSLVDFLQAHLTLIEIKNMKHDFTFADHKLRVATAKFVGRADVV